MNSLRKDDQNRRRRKILLAGIPLFSVLCLILMDISFATRWSYDIPFQFQWWRSPETNAVMVYVREQSLSLGRFNGALDRNRLADLIDILTSQKARLVLIDFALSSNNAPSGTNENLARAIRENGHVVIGGKYSTSDSPGLTLEKIDPPMKMLREAVHGNVGHLEFYPIDSDDAVRQIPQGLERWPSASALGANLLLLESGQPTNSLDANKWLNPISAKNAGVSRAFYLEEIFGSNGIPPNVFHDKIVFVGSESSVKRIGESSDRFGGPWNFFGGKKVPGVDIHASALLNQWHGNYLRRLNIGLESLLAFVFGGLLTVPFIFISGRKRIFVIPLVFSLGTASSFILHFFLGYWWNWLSLLPTSTICLVAAFYISPPRPRVFISYKSDANIKTKHTDSMLLESELSLNNVEVWHAPRDLSPGSNWKRKAEIGISRVDNFILMLDDAAMKELAKQESPVRIEVDFAWDRRKLGRFHFLILCIERPSVAVPGDLCPPGWDEKKWKDFTEMTPAHYDAKTPSDLSKTVTELWKGIRHHPEWKPKALRWSTIDSDE